MKLMFFMHNTKKNTVSSVNYILCIVNKSPVQFPNLHLSLGPSFSTSDRSQVVSVQKAQNHLDFKDNCQSVQAQFARDLILLQANAQPLYLCCDSLPKGHVIYSY